MIAGRYALDREIGRGGCGVVWLGRDDTLGRQVALKRIGLLPGADETDRARAEREARLGARLNHPHVVSVFDVVADGDSDSRWLVMEYVEGANLARIVQQRGRLTPDEAAPLLRQAAEALAAAHAAGIAHRDVKPSNILVTPAGQVKLTDFGIARIATDNTLTQTGLVTGSPAYLAPEVASGGRGNEAADVWSLGATLYHVLAGRPPYDIGDNVIGGLYRIVHDEPPRLPESGWLAPLLEATMVKDPSRRWSMAQVRDYLTAGHFAAPTPHQPGPDDTRAIAPAPTSAPVSGPAHPGSSVPTRRRRRPGLLLVALAVVLALALAVGLWAVLSSGHGGTRSPGAGPSRKPSPSAKAVPKPTATAMASFIRDYVTTVSDDPDSSWKMLTPKFQRESGGLERYRRFWDPATNGRVLDITADPDNLTVSYQVHFDHFHNGPGPTVLDLTYDNGTYKINGEHSRGFKPVG